MQISLSQIVKKFGNFTALNGINLEIRDGELFTLLGPSGCGKTTTLRLIAGFYQPDSGEIRFNDRVVNAVPTAQRGIGIVFQNYALWPHMTVAQNIAYGLKIKKMDSVEIRKKVAEGLEKVGLTGMGNRYPGQLSGGQQQRVALARALVLSPEVLLLDEPLSNLDAKVRMKVRAEIRQIQQDLKITTIYVTHDQEEALTLSDQIAVMREGSVAQVGTPKDLYERPDNAFTAHFIGTNNLLEGTVIERNGDHTYQVDTKIGKLNGISVKNLRSGSQCTVAIRPENIEFNGEDAVNGCNIISGKIFFASYLGNILRYDVQTPSGVLIKADVKDPWHHQLLSAGTDVCLRVMPNTCLIIDDRINFKDESLAAGGEAR